MNEKRPPRRKDTLYRTWQRMRGRCKNPNDDAYPHYGGRGISVCKRWDESFDAFVEDMVERPGGLTLDRKDNDGNYEPGNCRWATAKEQANNKRNSRMLTFKGRTQSLAQWTDDVGMAQATVYGRLARGWSTRKALTVSTLSNEPTTIVFRGEEKTLREWSDLFGVKKRTILDRLRLGWNIEDAITGASRRPDTPIEFDGKTQTVTEWAAEYDISRTTLLYRIRRGWGMERALTARGQRTNHEAVR